MTTAGGGWTLFGYTNASQCAEELPYGVNSIYDTSNGAYVSFAMADANVGEFMQTMAVDGVNVDFHTVWTFDTTRTLINQFLDAFNGGVNVDWEVTDSNGSTYSFSGQWWYSDGLYQDDSSIRAGGSYFSSDDGLWGANNGEVNGNGGNYLYSGWGHGNDNSSDSACSTVHMGGSSTSSSSLVNMMYYR